LSIIQKSEQVETPDLILPNIVCHDKTQVLETISKNLADICNINQLSILTRLSQKEKTESSGIGEGVAIPHARILQLDKPVSILITLRHKLEFGAPDNKPVDVIYTMLSPRSDGILHVQRLSATSRLLKNQALCDQIRNSTDIDTIRTLIQSPEGWVQAA